MGNKITTQLVIDGKNKAGPAFNEASKQLGGIKSQAKAAGVAIAAALSVSALSSFIRGSIDAADAAGKSAQATGLLIDEYTALKYAAELAGVGAEKLDGALGKFNKTIDGAAQGGKSQEETFARLGISIRDASGNFKTSGVLLAEVADVFQQLPDGVQKSALAMQLFGKSGAAMIPLLNAGAAGLADMRAEAEALGVVIGPEQAARSEVFNDNLTKIGQASDGAANKVAGELLPALIDLSELMLDLNKNTDASGIFADVLGGALKVLATVAIIVGATFVTVGQAIAGAAAAAFEAAKGNFGNAADILKQTAEDYKKTTLDSVKRIDNLWSGAGEAAAKAAIEQKKQFAANLADQKNYVEQTKANSDKLLKDAEKSIKAQTALQAKATADLKKLQDERLAIDAKYASAKATLNGAGGSSAPSYAAAQDLKVGARAALRAGDVEGAKRQADEALKVLLALKEAGGNTYGLGGFADELNQIEQAANGIEQSAAEDHITAIGVSIADLQVKADALKNISVTPVMDEAAAAELTARLQALATALGQTLTIPVQMVAVAPAGLTANGASGDPGVPGFSGGGRVRGPGSGTSDSIMARLSNGEFVLRAAAVRAYGPALLEKMNGLRIPKFADGGLVGAAMSAPVGQSGRDLGRVDLNLPGGETISLLADQQNFTDLVRRQKLKNGSTRRT